MSENGNGNSGTEIVKRPIAANERGLVLRTLDEMWRFAECVIQAGIAPHSFKTPQQVLISVQMGAEIGMGPMRAVNSIAPINGRPCLWGDAGLALVKASGKLEYIQEYFDGEGDDMAAVCKTKRRGEPEVATLFSVADAKRAKLWGKTSSSGKPSTWVTYPNRMLMYRARGFNLRDNFPDVLCGMHLVEEMQDLPPDAPEPSEAAVDVPTREERREAVASVVDVTPEQPVATEPQSIPAQTPLERVAAAIKAGLQKTQLVVDDELVLEILPKQAERAAGGSRHMYLDETAWTDEVAEKCLTMLEEYGVDPDWLPAEPVEVSNAQPG